MSQLPGSSENKLIVEPSRKVCPVCRNNVRRFLFAWKGQPFEECSCGLIMEANPPSAEQSRSFYEGSYYNSLAPIIPDLLQARLSIYGDFLREFRAYRKTGKLLDVGCGHGDFLRLAAADGWEGWGIDPSAEAIETALKIPGTRAFQGTSESCSFEPDTFDVITLWNVLDCLPDPGEALRTIRGWLRPGGLLLIRTPNADFHYFLFTAQNFLAPLLKKTGWERDASIFLRCNFRAKPLKQLLAVCGYESIEIENGKMTHGDPYRITRGQKLIPFLKKTVFGMARLLEILSGGKVLAGSAMIAKATKEVRQSWSFPDPSPERERLNLKRIGLHLLAVLGYILGLPLWKKFFGGDREIRILTYHSLHPFGNDLSVKPADFESHLDFIKGSCDILPLETAVDMLEHGKLPLRPSVVLTFDDGFQDNDEFLLPAFLRNKIPVTVFAVTGEKRNAGYLKGEPPLLSDAQICEMASAGIEFGSHGVNHQRFSELSEKSLFQELTDSKKKMEMLTRRSIHFLAYPYGRHNDFNESVRDAVRNSGYRAAFSSVYGTSGFGTEMDAICRIGIDAADSLFTLRAKLNGALDLLAWFEHPRIRKTLASLLPEKLTDPVLLTTVDFPPDQNGISTIAGHLSKLLANAKGLNFCVVAPGMPGDRKYDQGESCRIWRFPGNEMGWCRLLVVFAFTAWVILRHRIRKILAMTVAYGGFTCWLISLFYRLDYVLFAYGYEFEKFRNIPWLRSFYLRIYGRARAIIVCSSEVGKRLASFGVDAGKIVTVYPGVDTARFFPLDEKDRIAFMEQKNLQDRRIILSAGRLVDRKGHDKVLEALIRVKRDFPDVLYLIAGTGPAEEKLRTLTDQFGLNDCVRFLGSVSDQDLNGYYNSCEFFIMPSREIPEEGHIEGFGIVFLEANACAKPVIGGRSGGVVEAVSEGNTGLLADPESVDDISDKMIYFLSHPGHAKEMGQAGLVRQKKDFVWTAYADKVSRYLFNEKEIL